jgi:hypothetical protein
LVLLLRASIILLALSCAGAAQAQDVVDPIGALLDQVDEDTAEAMGATPQSLAPPAPLPPPAPPPAPARPAPTPPAQSPFPYGSEQAPQPARPQVASPPALPYASPPAAYAPVRPPLTGPVFVDDYDRTPERPLNSVELGYESRLRSSFASAQGMQGPLDGAWMLRAAGGRQVYALLLVDKGSGSLEGAWRDPRRQGARDSSGFLTSIQKTGSQLTASFYPRPGAGIVTLTLRPIANGEWSGELVEGGSRTEVTLVRE